MIPDPEKRSRILWYGNGIKESKILFLTRVLVGLYGRFDFVAICKLRNSPAKICI